MLCTEFTMQFRNSPVGFSTFDEWYEPPCDYVDAHPCGSPSRASDAFLYHSSKLANWPVSFPSTRITILCVTPSFLKMCSRNQTQVVVV